MVKDRLFKTLKLMMIHLMVHNLPVDLKRQNLMDENILIEYVVTLHICYES